jgi:DNA-binding beta-propeller fold protein YncE
MKRRIPAGDGVYNLAVTRDGKLLVGTNKRGKSVSVIDIASGRELAKIPTQRRVVHGVAISSDDRYAFISVEGVGSEPGTVEMIDLKSMQRVASADVGQMAGGSTYSGSRTSRHSERSVRCHSERSEESLASRREPLGRDSKDSSLCSE